MSRRDDYRLLAEKKLDTLAARVKLLRAEARETEAGARLAVNERLREAEKAMAEGKAALDRLVDAGEEEWEELKERLDSFRDRAQGLLDHLLDVDEKRKS